MIPNELSLVSFLQSKKKLPKDMACYPTEPFTILELQNPLCDVRELYYMKFADLLIGTL